MTADWNALTLIGVSALSALVFLQVGRAVRQRPVSPELAEVRNAFSTWWYGLGTTSLLGILQVGAFLLRPADAALITTIGVFSLAALCTALWGLLYYLVFLFTDSPRYRVPLAAAYTLFFAAILYLVLRLDAKQYYLKGYTLTTVEAQSLQGSVTVYLFIAVLLLPQMLAAFAYLTLYRKVGDRVQRRRILIVGLSILLWFASGFVGLNQSIGDSLAWQFLSRLIGLAAAGAIYYAYTRLGAPPKEAPRAG